MQNASGGGRGWGIETADGLLLFTALVWGINYSVVKFALAEIPPAVFMGLRFVVASLAMLLLAKAFRRSLRFQRRHIPALIGLGLLGNSCYQALFIFGISKTTAENSSLILATVPAWVAVAGVVLARRYTEHARVSASRA